MEGLLAVTVAAALTLVLARGGHAGEMHVRRALGAGTLRLRLHAAIEASGALMGAGLLGTAGAAGLARLLGEVLAVPGAGDGTAEPRAAVAAAAGLLMANLGLAGVVLLGIQERTRAIGIRKAVEANDLHLRLHALKPACRSRWAS